MPAYAGYDLAGGRGSHNNSIDGSPVPRGRAVAPTKDAHPLFAFGPDTPGAQSCARKERNRSASMRCRATWSA